MAHTKLVWKVCGKTCRHRGPLSAAARGDRCLCSMDAQPGTRLSLLPVAGTLTLDWKVLVGRPMFFEVTSKAVKGNFVPKELYSFVFIFCFF